jgi:hypothetical protein
MIRAFSSKKELTSEKRNKYPVIVQIRNGNASLEMCPLQVRVNQFSVEKL